MNVNMNIVWIYYGSLVENLASSSVAGPNELANLGWNVTLICTDAPEDLYHKNVKLVYFEKPSIYLLGYLFFHIQIIQFLIKMIHQEVVVLFNPQSTIITLPLLLIKFFFKNKMHFVCDHRDIPCDHTGIRYYLWKGYYFFAYFVINNFLDGQTTTSTYLAKYLNIPDNKLLCVWPSGVYLEQYANPQPRITGDILRIIYTGTVSTDRNIFGLCEAVKKVGDHNNTVTLDIYGSGSIFFELEEMYRGSSIVNIHKPVPRQEVPLILNNADIGILPFPPSDKSKVKSFLKLFEYLAAGLPIISTKIDTVIPLVQDEYMFWAGNGTVPEIVEAIINVYHYKKDLPLLGSIARKDAEKYTWQASIKILSDALSDHFLGK
jgi:glycosyltransferase involved in cell wall biosynthesis